MSFWHATRDDWSGVIRWRAIFSRPDPSTRSACISRNETNGIRAMLASAGWNEEKIEESGRKKKLAWKSCRRVCTLGLERIDLGPTSTARRCNFHDRLSLATNDKTRARTYTSMHLFYTSMLVYHVRVRVCVYASKHRLWELKTPATSNQSPGYKERKDRQMGWSWWGWSGEDLHHLAISFLGGLSQRLLVYTYIWTCVYIRQIYIYMYVCT